MNCEFEPSSRLQRGFFARPTELVAQDLLGATLWHATPAGVTTGRIIETEAYLDATDPASHASLYRRGPVVMSREPGHVYMYRCMGIHQMFNIVAHEPGGTGAVLVRALEPGHGHELMSLRRGTGDKFLLCAGPGRLCQAMGFGAGDDLLDLVTDFSAGIVAGGSTAAMEIGPRVGVSRGAHLQLRFSEAGNRFVSPRRAILDRSA